MIFVDILMIYLPSIKPIEQHISDICPAELQLNKANACDKETPFLDLNIKVPSYSIYISQLIRFARCCASVFDFHSKNLQITS